MFAIRWSVLAGCRFLRFPWVSFQFNEIQHFVRVTRENVKKIQEKSMIHLDQFDHPELFQLSEQSSLHFLHGLHVEHLFRQPLRIGKRE